MDPPLEIIYQIIVHFRSTSTQHKQVTYKQLCYICVDCKLEFAQTHSSIIKHYGVTTCGDVSTICALRLACEKFSRIPIIYIALLCECDFMRKEYSSVISANTCLSRKYLPHACEPSESHGESPQDAHVKKIKAREIGLLSHYMPHPIISRYLPNNMSTMREYRHKYDAILVNIVPTSINYTEIFIKYYKLDYLCSNCIGM